MTETVGLVKRLHKKAWQLRSEYVRRKENGICFTCDKREWDEQRGENNWKAMQAGHFKHGVLDYDDLNIHCQCPQCNKWKHGKLDEYAVRLVRKYGCEVLEELEKRADKEKLKQKWTVEELELIIKDFENKIKCLDY